MSTSLSQFLVLDSYAFALRAFLESTPEDDASIRQLLGDLETSEPESQADFARWRMIRALRVAYDVAASEGLDETIHDILDAIAEITDEQEARLRTLLEPSPELSQRLDLSKIRDGFLPILRIVRMALDLRVAESSESAKLLPLVTARFAFDDNVGAGDSVVFQIPLSVLDSLHEDIAQMRSRIDSLPSVLRTATLDDSLLDRGGKGDATAERQ